MNRPLTTEEIELLLGFARDHITMAEQFRGPVYGPYLGGDPHNFDPDPEDATPEQLERHKAACEAWTRGERNFPRDFGLGATEDRAKDERCKRIRRLLEEL